MPLSPNAHAFTTRLAGLTGLNPSVIAGWVMAETSGHDTTNGPNNWLNVGSFDSGFSGGGANAWANPNTAAAATAAFLLGKPVGGIRPPLGGGAPSVRSILSTVGQGPGAQVQAIQNSGWASSHYNGNLMADVKPFLGQNWQIGGGGQVGTGGIAPAPGGTVARKLGMTPPTTTLNKAAIVSNYLANEPRINPFTLPIPGTGQRTGTDIPASSNPLLQPGQPLALGQPLTKTIPGHQILQQAHNRLSKIAGTGLNLHPTLRAGTVAGGFLPKGATYIKQRADQGRDGQTNPGGPILANGNGKVVGVLSDPNGFGPSYPVIAFTSGPYAGRTLYFGHTLSTVKQGQTVRPGQVISHTGTHGVGNATTPGWFEIGFAPGGIPGAFGQPTPF